MANLIISHISDHLTCVSACTVSITTPGWKNAEREERDSCFLVKLLALKKWKQGKRPIQKCVTKHFTADLGALLGEGKGEKKRFWTTVLPNGIMYTQQFPIYNTLLGSWTQAQVLPAPVPVTSFMTDIKQTGYRPQSCYQKYLIFQGGYQTGNQRNNISPQNNTFYYL